MKKRLAKSRKDRKLDGVCGGIAEYFNIDSTIVRLVWVALCFINGFGLILYIIALIVMPYSENDYSAEEDVENLKSANVDDEDTDTKKKSSKKDNEKKNGKLHSDEEFDSYFSEK